LLIPPITLLKDRSYQLAWLTALIISLYSVNDKVGVHYVPPFVYLFFGNILMCFIVTPIVVMRKKAIFFREWTRNKTPIILGSIMIPSSYLLILSAMRISKVSYIVAIRHLSVVFAVLLGSFILKEEHGKVRFFASLCIFAGVLLIAYLG
ncbi:MAG: EamA family transporter, partial [Thermodesulfobacteriota bacterium]